MKWPVERNQSRTLVQESFVKYTNEIEHTEANDDLHNLNRSCSIHATRSKVAVDTDTVRDVPVKPSVASQWTHKQLMVSTEVMSCPVDIQSVTSHWIHRYLP